MKFFKYRNVGYKRITGDTQLDYSLKKKRESIKISMLSCFFVCFYVEIKKLVFPVLSEREVFNFSKMNLTQT